MYANWENIKKTVKDELRNLRMEVNFQINQEITGVRGNVKDLTNQVRQIKKEDTAINVAKENTEPELSGKGFISDNL
jgi:RNase P/RNase MRP subunit p29